jgi:hypothetical protein
MILGVFFEPVPMVMVSGRSHFCLRSCLLFSRRGPRHGVGFTCVSDQVRLKPSAIE